MKTVFTILLALSSLICRAQEGTASNTTTSDTVQVKGRTMFTLEAGGLFCLRRTEFTKGYFRLLKGVKPTLAFSAFQLTANIDKEIKKRLYIGGGFGFDISKHTMALSLTDNISVAIPAYFDIRYHFVNGKATPYIAAHTGAAIYATRGDFGGGAMAGLDLGGRVAIDKNLALSIFAGYRFQHLALRYDQQFTDENGVNTYVVRTTSHTFLQCMTVGLGFSF